MSATPQRIVVVGASLAGLRGAEALRSEGFDGELVVIGEERHRPYDRPPLSKGLLAGTIGTDDLALRSLRALDAQWLLGEPATALDLDRHTVQIGGERLIAYDRLLIATGSRPRRLPALDPSRPGIHELRTLQDAIGLRDALARGPRVAIVGAGFIGTEVASTARSLGLAVDVISLDPPLAVAGELVSQFTAELMAEHGVRLRVGRSVAAVHGDGRVEEVVLDDGTRLPCDLVLSAVGAAPATGWLAGSGLTLDDGVLCDPWCAAVDAPMVAAAGDVARWPHGLFGTEPIRVEHWTNAAEQARVAAHSLLHGPGHGPPHSTVPSFWSEHFGLRLQSIGLPALADELRVLDGDPAERRFAAAALRDGVTVGAVAYGMPRALFSLRAEIEAAGACLP